MTEAMVLQRLERQSDRVRDHSAQVVNRRVVRDIDANLERCQRDGRDAVISRLAELDHEWDIDRVLMANFALLGGAAYAIGLDRYIHRPAWGLGRRRRGWLYVFGAQLGFLFMHAAVGWCPPAVVLRRLGVRTKAEIEAERSLLLTTIEPELRSVDGLAPLSAAAPQVAS